MILEPSVLFARVFRTQLCSNLEYSFDDDPTRHATMVAGGSGFPAQLREFAASLPFASKWEWAVRKFAAHVRPDAYLLRTDWQGDEPQAVTVYCRFPHEPDANAFRDAVAQARPMGWSGPSTEAVARVLGAAGPRGIAFRVNPAGMLRTSVYFKLGADRAGLQAATCHDLVRLCGFGEEVAEEIIQDVASLYSPGPVGVIGLDDGGEGIPGSLKFDPANVVLQQARALLVRKGVPALPLARVAHMAGLLRARWLSYMGIKYGSSGFAGWRAYYSYEPFRLPPAGSFRIVSERSPLPTLRLPHY